MALEPWGMTIGHDPSKLSIMKTQKNWTNALAPTFVLLLALCMANRVVSQEVAPTATHKTHISKEAFPKGNLINMVHGWGGMTVAINEPKAGTDFTPLLKGLKDNLCQVPHWGYLEKGKIQVVDFHKNTEIIKAGEVFYMAPGHTLIVEEDARIIDFSPEREMKELNEFVLKKIAQMQKGG